MNKKSPFLIGFPTRLFGSAKHSAQAFYEKARKKLLESCVAMQNLFADEIDPEIFKKYSNTQRVRHFPNELVFWGFLYQIAGDDSSCAKTVSELQKWSRQAGSPVPSANTSAYCKARQALPMKLIEAVYNETILKLEAALPEEEKWRGHRVLAEDGTSVIAADTDQNREEWPYAAGQDEGCGFPIVQLGGLIDLNHGGVIGYVDSSRKTSELEMHSELEFNHLRPGDVLIADRYYSGWERIAVSMGRGVESIGRSHHARKVDFRRGKKLGPDERLVMVPKPKRQSKGSKLTATEWNKLPDVLPQRIIRYTKPSRSNGSKKTGYIYTTLLDHKKYPKDEVLSLHFHRWEIEVRFRDLKSTLRMDQLLTKSPEMVRKEIMMHMIFYNLIRLLMLKAGQTHGVNHRRLSFRGAQQLILAMCDEFRGCGNRPQKKAGLKQTLLGELAKRIVVERPGRAEPRRVKRRPKCTRWLQRPRHKYFENFRTDCYPPKILDEAA